MARALHALGMVCARVPWLVLGIWFLVIAAVIGLVTTFGAQASNDLELPGTESQQVKDLLTDRFPPQQNGANPIVFHVDSGKLSDAQYKPAVTASVKALRNAPHVYSVTGPFSDAGQNAGLVSKDGRTAFAPVLLDVGSGELDEEIAQDVFDATQPAQDAGIEVEAGSAIGTDLSTEPTESSELVGILCAMLILSLVLGSLVAMGLPILTAAVGLGVALGTIGLLGHVLDVPTTGATLATMIGLGVGIDYALFLITRHQEQLAAGVPMHESIARTVATSGSAVVFAGGTVVVALVSLRVAGIPLLSTLGIASAIAVLTAVLGAITLLPALLGLLGHRVNALKVPFVGRRHKGPGFWQRWAGFLGRHAVWVTVVSVAALIPLIAPAPSLQLAQEDVGAAPPDTTERKAYDLITAGFGIGYNGPLQVASALDPPATPSQEYTDKYNRATSLQQDLARLQKELPQQQEQLKAESAELQSQQAALERQQDELLAQQQSLEQQGAALQSQQAGLEAEQARLQNQAAQLRAQEQRLRAEQRRLQRERDQIVARARRLEREARALAREARPLVRRLAVLLARERILERRIEEAEGDPVLQARLQARLDRVEQREERVRDRLSVLRERGEGIASRARALRARAERLQQQAAPAQAQAASLRRRANQLQAQGAALQRQADQLQAEADRLRGEQAALQQQAASLRRQGAALQQQAADLQQRADDLKAQQQQAEQEKKEAEQLKDELTAMLTQAGGDDRNTDPRVVKLQDALSGTSGVVSLTPPQTNDRGDVVLLSAVPSTGPADDATSALLDRVRNDVVPSATEEGGIDTYVGGYTASYVDLAELISAKLFLVIGTIIALGFLLLMIAFRSLLVPLQAAVTNLLSATAAFGILTATFQWGWGIDLVGLDTVRDTVPIASYVPLMMFAVLFGLSMDYEVFLVSHVQQHHLAGEPARQAAASGLASSGKITTAACLIMTSVFASFILNGDPTIKQFGVGLASAVLLAGILVVTLAPASIALLGESAWWLPRWLDRILPHMHLEGEAPAEPEAEPAVDQAKPEPAVEEPAEEPVEAAAEGGGESQPAPGRHAAEPPQIPGPREPQPDSPRVAHE